MAFQPAFSALPQRLPLLKKRLKTQHLNYEQMQTVLQEAETIVNNRPLTYVYPTELETYYY